MTRKSVIINIDKIFDAGTITSKDVNSRTFGTTDINIDIIADYVFPINYIKDMILEHIHGDYLVGCVVDDYYIIDCDDEYIPFKYQINILKSLVLFNESTAIKNKYKILQDKYDKLNENYKTLQHDNMGLLETYKLLKSNLLLLKNKSTSSKSCHDSFFECESDSDSDSDSI